jgi:hypothetical protein
MNMPMEFLHGQPLSPDELEMIRQQFEAGFDTINAIDSEIRGSCNGTGRTWFRNCRRRNSPIT